MNQKAEMDEELRQQRKESQSQTLWTGKFTSFIVFSILIDIGKGSCLAASDLEETKDQEQSGAETQLPKTYKLTYKVKKSLGNNSKSKDKNVGVEDDQNRSAQMHPEIYTHDGETFLQQVFDYYLNQGHVIRFKVPGALPRVTRQNINKFSYT